ncbi:PAS domain S-box protein [Oryzifoliimicrobium ureilyticus]|uniref:PAS domain S-box protein n=1 Tax=Oryzifoliimicrobium ureilyticus TaxID=3113724 RepID=UPI0030760568
MPGSDNDHAIHVRHLLDAFNPTSPLGPPPQWPDHLRTIVSTMVAAPLQIVLFWGEDYVALYNDAYAPTIGNKHPHAFGRPASEYWTELWDDLKPLLDQVRQKGEPIYMKDRPFYIERHGRPETVTFDISYSAVSCPKGKTDGVLCIVNETTDRTTYEKRLRESEARFRNMADHAPVMLWLVDENGHCTYLNTRWQEFTGQQQGEGNGLGWIDAVHPDDQHRFKTAFHEALNRRAPFSEEYRLRRHDGVYRWAIDTAEPRFTSDGTFLGYIGSVIDIDERHEYERQLRERGEELKALTNSIDQMVWSTRPDGFHDFYNDRWYEYTGVPYGSTDGAAWNGMFHPEDRERAWSEWRECLRTGKPYHIEYRLRHHTGEYRWVIGRAKAVRDENGAITRWYGTCTDFHELKTTELRRAAIIELEAKTANLDDPGAIAFAAAQMLGDHLAATRVGYATFDPVDGKLLIERDWTKDSIESLSGVRNLRSYRNLKELLQRGDMLVVDNVRGDARTSGKAKDLIALHAVSFVAVPVHEQNGLVALMFATDDTPRTWTDEDLAFIREIASRTRYAVERKRAEHDLRQLTSSLEDQVVKRTEELRKSEERLRQSQKMEAIGQLTGGIAHDFNNNLAIIMSGLNLLKKRFMRGDTRDVERLIDGATEGAQKAANLVQRLLAFSRRQPLSPEPLDCNNLINGMSELLSRSIGKHIEVKMELSDDLWWTTADHVQLENALLNLAVNARDAMPDGGVLSISTRNVTVSGNSLRNHGIPAGEYVRISIADNGTGMPDEVREKAFEPFFTTKSVGKGSGLGLSQVFGFVRQSGGYIRLESQLGHGTVVTIQLPRLIGHKPSIVKSSPHGPDFQGGGQKILVVEDEDRVRYFANECLRELGYDVTLASGSAEAIQIVNTGRKFDLLFTDVVMPGMNGRKLADALVKLQPDLKVIYASGYTGDAVMLNNALDPERNFLQKPYTIEQLAKKLQAVLQN